MERGEINDIAQAAAGKVIISQRCKAIGVKLLSSREILQMAGDMAAHAKHPEDIVSRGIALDMINQSKELARDVELPGEEGMRLEASFASALDSINKADYDTAINHILEARRILQDLMFQTVVACECGEAKAIEEKLGKEALRKILATEGNPSAVEAEKWKQLEPDWWALREKISLKDKVYDAEIVEIRGEYEPRITMITKEGVTSAISLKAFGTLEDAKNAAITTILGATERGNPSNPNSEKLAALREILSTKTVEEAIAAHRKYRHLALTPDDLEVIDKHLNRLKSGSTPRDYVTITDPGKTTFKRGEIVSRKTFEEENQRVIRLGEKPATGNGAKGLQNRGIVV